jgi:diketogulonate reductase-like aldo/keto reductase
MEYIDVQGERLPAIGFGTGGLRGDEGIEGVRHALEIGYRHIDTARIYGNESEVGEGLRRSGVPRQDVFITTKLMGEDLVADHVRPAVEESLGRLGLDQIDLLLIHFPTEEVPLESTLGAMAEQQAAGKVRHLGVSNFRTPLLQEAMGYATIFANQVPYQVGGRQRGLTELVAKEDIVLTAYSPLRGDAIASPVVADIAKAHGKAPQQVALRWLVQQPHVTPIPRSATPSRRVSNFDIFDFELSADEMARVSALSDAG